MKQKAAKFNMPKWMECMWRREVCGKRTCRICGEILKHRQEHIDAGEDPDDLAVVLGDVETDFKQALQIIKQDAEGRGFEIANIDSIQEPPGPEEFPLYRRVTKWQNALAKVVAEADDEDQMWLYTEEGQDLIWYKATLCAKVYRQLSNRWHLEHKDDYGEFDYEYTQYVLEECLKILKKSLMELTKMNIVEKSHFLIALANLESLESKILKI